MDAQDKTRSWYLRLLVALTGWFVLSLSLGWTWGRPAERTKPAPQTSETKQASQVPVAIADSEIIPRAEQTVKLLQKLRSEVAADATLNSIQRDFAAFAEKSDRRRESEAETISKSRSAQRLSEIQREWSLEQTQLDDWDQALARGSRILVAQEQSVGGIIETWRATQAAVAKKFLFKAVLQRRVEDVLREAQTTRLAIQEQTTKLLKLQSQIADRLATLAKIRAEIDQAREEFSRGLFALDSPPLWQALFRREAQETIMTEVSGSARRFAEDLQEFLQTYSQRILLHVVLFVTLVGVFYLLRRGLTAEAAQRLGASSAIFVLERPFDTALLLALTALPLFYPAAASAVLRIAIVPTVIPLIRLLPRLLPKILPYLVYMLVALYVLDFLRYLLPADWLLSRLLLLIIAAGGCLGLGFFLYTRGRQLSALGARERLILLAIRLALLLFAVSVLSNFVGNMILAEVLVAMPVRIAYMAALVWAGALLLMTLVAVALQSRPARWLRSAREHGELLASRCRILIRVLAFIFWTVVSLHILGVFGDLAAAWAAFLELQWKLGAAEISVRDVGLFFAVLFGAVVFSRILRFVLTEEILPRISLPRGVPGAVDVLSRYGIMLLGFFIALAAAGVDLSKVTLLISALGVGIGFGLQGVVNNFVSGLILVFEHPVQVGDFVEVGTTFGEVRKIGFRASVLRTPDGAEVIIPNSELVGAKFINWSLSDRLRRIGIPVSVAYGTDPDRVIDILLGVARKHPAVLAYPAPFAVFDRFADSALNLTLFCWSSVDEFFLARSELTIAINRAFKEAGIQIPFPQQDVHLHWTDGPRSTVESSIEPAKEPGQRKSDKAPAFVSVDRPLAKK
jgi:small-conductance mechanosensitive channel